MRFYVYELIDPFSGEPFYVGKGTKRRIECHEAEAKKGTAGEKCDRIRAIWERGGQVERSIVQRFDDEQDAYDFERARIAEVIAKGTTLTNIALGGGGASALPFKWNAARLKPHLNTVRGAIALLKSGAWFSMGPFDITDAVLATVVKVIEDLGPEQAAALLN